MTWRPEVVVDQALATRLIRDQYSAVGRVEPLGEGWDYTAFLVDGDVVFRFPRRAVVLPGMEREIATLPRLDLPVAVPKPVFVGEPSAEYPWRFYGARYIHGAEPLEISDDVRRRVSMDLARALRALHAHDAADLPEDANQRANMTRRVPWARAALASLGVAAEHILGPAEKLGLVRTASVLCHGDLHFRQLLTDDGLNGIIDWVDVCRADPGIDLSLLWSFAPRETFRDFLAEYGVVSDESLIVARVLALGLNATLANYARDVANGPVERAARAALERALAE